MGVWRGGRGGLFFICGRGFVMSTEYFAFYSFLLYRFPFPIVCATASITSTPTRFCILNFPKCYVPCSSPPFFRALPCRTRPLLAPPPRRPFCQVAAHRSRAATIGATTASGRRGGRPSPQPFTSSPFAPLSSPALPLSTSSFPSPASSVASPVPSYSLAPSSSPSKSKKEAK